MMSVAKYLIITLVCLFTLSAKGQSIDADSTISTITESEMEFDPNTDNVNYLRITNIGSQLSRLKEFGFGHIALNRRGDIFNSDEFRIDGITMYNPAIKGNMWSVISGFNNLRRLNLEHLAALGSGQLEHQSPIYYDKLRIGLNHNPTSQINNIRFSLSPQGLPSDYELDLAGRIKWGKNRIFSGTFVENYSLNGSLTRVIGNHNSLTLSAMGLYSMRGLRSCATDETFSLVHSLYGDKAYGYNPSVGVQNGKTRDANTSLDKALWLGINHKYVSSDNRSRLSSTLAAIFHKQGYSTLARFDCDNPYPDYYAYLPSHHQGDAAQQIAQLWQTDKSVSQIDWHNIYQINYANRTADGLRAKHIIEQRVLWHKSLRANLAAEHQFNNNLSAKLWVDAVIDRSDYYKVVEDLLGGDYWLDIDTYLVDDVYYGDMVQNNIPTPDRRVSKGDAFGYNYSIYNKMAAIGLNVRYQNRNTMVEAQYVRQESSIHRHGRYEKETFPGFLSRGNSQQRRLSAQSFNFAAEYQSTNGVCYSIRLNTERRMPTYQDIFIAPKNQNAFVDSPQSPRFNSAEFAVRANRHWGAFKITAFTNRTKSANYIVNQYDVITTRYSQFVTNDLSTKSYGVEIEAAVDVTPQVELSGFFSSGRYQYNSNPHFKQYDDRNGSVLNEDIIAHLSGIPLHYAPEQMLAANLRWQPRYGVWVDISLSHCSPRSAKIDMIRRTDRILTLTDKLDVKERLMTHSNLNEVTTIDLYLGRRFRLRNNALILSVGINNLTDHKIERYGYEQYHLTKVGSGYKRYYDAAQIKKCYDYGRNINFSASFAFN